MPACSSAGNIMVSFIMCTMAKACGVEPMAYTAFAGSKPHDYC